jgi:phosphonate transport system ATP-binding protein
MPNLRRRVAQVHQGLHLVDRLSARDNLLIGALARCQGAAAWRAGLAGRYPPAIEAEADAWLTRLGLAAWAEARADRLSGGERQRVAIGRAGLQRPDLLLADEATAQLDPQAAKQACDWLRDAAGSGTLVSVVHQLELLPRLADRVIGLRQGQVVLDRVVDSSPSLQQALADLYEPGPTQDIDPTPTQSPGLCQRA